MGEVGHKYKVHVQQKTSYMKVNLYIVYIVPCFQPRLLVRALFPMHIETSLFLLKQVFQNCSHHVYKPLICGWSLIHDKNKTPTFKSMERQEKDPKDAPSI